MKPHCIIEYNKNMRAVDKNEMMISSTEHLRKSLKWYKKLFLHFLDNVLLNSVYNVKIGRNISLADFQLIFIREIIQKYHKVELLARKASPSCQDQPLWLSERLFP
jgi:hypothetical protein